MNGGVGWVVELLRHETIGAGADHFGGLGNRSTHAFSRRREYEVGSHRSQQATTLDRHRLGHGQRKLVTFGGTYERQGDACVAAGGLDNVRFFVDLSRFLASFDHGDANAVLDAVERLKKLALREDRRLSLRNQSVDANHWRIANCMRTLVKVFPRGIICPHKSELQLYKNFGFIFTGIV